MKAPAKLRWGNFKVIINPEIISYGQPIVEKEEGCVSWPEYICTVERYSSICCKYQNITGNFIQETISGMTARIF